MNFIGVVLLFIAALLQAIVLPVLLPGAVLQNNFRPDLLLLLVVSVSIVAGLQTGIIWAFIGGFLLDLFSSARLGTDALAFILVALIASIGAASPFRSNIILPVAMVAICTFFYYLFTMAIMAVTGNHPAWVNGIVHTAAPAMVINVILTPVFYGVLSWLARRLQPTLPEEWQ